MCDDDEEDRDPLEFIPWRNSKFKDHKKVDETTKRALLYTCIEIGKEEGLLNDEVSSDEEWEEQEYENPPKDSFPKPYFEMDKNNHNENNRNTYKSSGMRPTFLNGNVFFNLHFKMFLCAQSCSYILNLIVGHPNGTLAKIIAIGNLRLTSNIVLFDVLVVPEYCDLNLVKTMGTGNEFSGLYLFAEDKYLKSKFGLSNSLFVCHVSKQLCCSRLGHPSDQVLSIQSKNSHLIYNKHVSPYDICLKAKQTKDPFPLSDHKFGGDLVYLDLWGPYKVSESMENQLLSQNESELNLLNFFDNIDSILLKSPNNDKRDPSNGDVNVRASSDIDSPHPVIDEVTFAIQIDEYNNISEGS
ncbi:hypothetical protein Tco_0367700 [Tanacetum coccineum]